MQKTLIFRTRACAKMALLAVLLLQSAAAWAQSRVTGTVTDRKGEPLIGVSIVEKGQSSGGITDVNGKFSVSVKPGKTLCFSYVGFVTKEVVAKSGNMKVVLDEDNKALNDVVVIGYGTMKKTDITSSVASVKSEDFNKGAVLDAGQLIQGKVAGLQVQLPTGDPESSTSIMLRGVSSLMGNSDPLILVDGVPGSFSTVAPEDIESIDVLKDGSATAIYGTRGTNGVIIITTKGARRDIPTTIEYKGYISIANQLKKPDFMNASELRSHLADGYSNGGANDQDYGDDVDWLDEISRTAVSHSHNVTFRGGSASTGLVANLSYDNREGTFKKSDAETYRGRMEVTHRMFDDKLTTTLAIFASERNTDISGSTFHDIYRQACIQNPTQPIYDEDGNYVERDIYFYNNPVSILNETLGEGKKRNIRFTGSLEYKVLDELSIKAMYTGRRTNTLSSTYLTKKHPNTTEGGQNGYAYRYSSDFANNLVEITADYHQNFGLHHLGAIVGYNYEDNLNDYFYASNKDFPTDAYTWNKLEAGSGLTNGEAGMASYKYTDKLIGLFGRVTYNYDDRYLFMLSLRHEGSSKFGSDHKWGTFPGFSAGWRLNKERFLSDYTWIDDLKLRAGFGVTGININDPYQSLASLDYSTDHKVLINGTWINPLVSVRNANSDLRWEKKYEYNVGIDFGFLNGRISGSLDWYLRNTRDALWDYNVPTPPYLYSSIMANVGKIRNTGFEALVNVVPVRTGDFEWRSTISYSTNKNKLISISNDQFKMSTDWFTTGYVDEPIQTTSHRVKVGDPVGNFFGLRSVGVDEDGKWVVEGFDENGEKVYKLAEDANDEDRQVLGNGIPKHNLNWSNSIRYKNWDFNISMRGAFGFQILNYQRMYYSNPTINYNVLNSAFDLLPVVDLTTGKKTGATHILNDSQRYVSEYVEDGDYWKIDNVTIGYTFNMKACKYIQNLRVYASCLNLATITGYKGIDPEVGFSYGDYGTLAAGVDGRDKYPTTRSFTFGVNVTF